MQGIDLVTLLPLLVLSVAAPAILLAIPFKRSHGLTFALTLGALIICFGLLPVSFSTGSPQVTGLLTLDGYALFYIGLFLASAAVVALLAYGYLEGRKRNNEEFYILLLIATLGSCIIVSSSHLISFFLGLELLSLSLYALISYLRSAPIHFEAAIKYLVLTATSISVLLFGMALIYAELGTMNFYEIAHRIHLSPARPMLLTGSVLFLVGIGFKLAVAPFHLWTPDVYQGAPSPITAFIATSSKGAIFAFLLRFLTVMNLESLGPIFAVLAIISIGSMIIGNMLALQIGRAHV